MSAGAGGFAARRGGRGGGEGCPRRRRLGAERVQLSLHPVQAAEEIHQLRPRELRAEVARRGGGGGGGGVRVLQAQAEEGDGLGGAGQVAARGLDVRGPVDRLEQRRAAQGRAAELAAGISESVRKAPGDRTDDRARGSDLKMFLASDSHIDSNVKACASIISMDGKDGLQFHKVTCDPPIPNSCN